MCIYRVSDERVGADLGLEVNVGSYCYLYGRQDRWQLEVLIKIQPQDNTMVNDIFRLLFNRQSTIRYFKSIAK